MDDLDEVLGELGLARPVDVISDETDEPSVRADDEFMAMRRKLIARCARDRRKRATTAPTTEPATSAEIGNTHTL